MLRKMVMSLLVISIVLLVATMLATHFDLLVLRHSQERFAQGANQKATSRSRSAPPESALPMPDSAKFDVARIDPEQASVFAGRAPPNAEVRVLANGQLVATAKADEGGQWASVVEHPFAAGEYQLSLRTRSTGSTIETIGESVRITVAANEHSPPALAPSPKVTQRSEASPPGPIIFDYNESNLSTAGRQQAAALGEFLVKHKLRSVTLSGHADERGSDEFNMELSSQRLKTIAQYLHEFGYSGELKLVPKGRREPYLTPNRERLPREEALRLDRRVELHLMRE